MLEHAHRFVRVAEILLLAAVVGGCAPPPLTPSPTHVSAQTQSVGSIPAPVQTPVILPRPRPTQKPETYSVVVNNVSVQELLFALARDAKLNVDVSPGITGTVTLNAIDQTLQQLLTRIARQADVRWELEGPNLSVMPDSPFLRTYKIDYVNMARETTGIVGVSSQVGAGSSGGGGGSGSNTSTTTVRSTSTNKFWESMVENVQDILRETDKILPTGTTPAGVPAAAPAPAATAAQTAAGTAPTLVPTAAVPPAPTFREAASVIANRESGILTVRASGRQHEKIQEFLDRVMASAKRQVLIEATIVEVRLNNQSQRGIDWSILRRGPSGLSLTQNSTGVPSGVLGDGLTIGIDDPFNRLGNISATIRMLDSFGDVKVLSSPKMSVLNNQTALLKVVENDVYFTITANTTLSSTGVALTTYTTTPNVMPVGFVMNVTPQIGEDDAVILNIKPSVTSVVRRVQDPNPSLTIASTVPVVQTREMESMIKVNSGQIAVLGGLIEDRYTENEDSTPGLNGVPVVRNFFSNTNKLSQKIELVVFMRPIVVKDPSIDGDFRAYRSFLPAEDFMNRPNPGRPPAATAAPGMVN